ncbi:MAG: hypothetical protein JWM34_4811 [Ilumatobacteraceae bacterium]|nr:hypothetical protein [Ilumatobacteraceae bacterium]
MAADPSPSYSYRDLSQLQALQVDHLMSLYMIELGGEALYSAMADRVGNDEVAQLLRRNGREEAGHARRVGRAIAIKCGEFVRPSHADEQLPVGLPDRIDGNFLKIVMQVEFDGDAGYQRWADNEPDEAVQRLLRLNGREESIHGRRIERALAILVES